MYRVSSKNLLARTQKDNESLEKLARMPICSPMITRRPAGTPCIESTPTRVVFSSVSSIVKELHHQKFSPLFQGWVLIVSVVTPRYQCSFSRAPKCGWPIRWILYFLGPPNGIFLRKLRFLKPESVCFDKRIFRTLRSQKMLSLDYRAWNSHVCGVSDLFRSLRVVFRDPPGRAPLWGDYLDYRPQTGFYSENLDFSTAESRFYGKYFSPSLIGGCDWGVEDGVIISLIIGLKI